MQESADSFYQSGVEFCGRGLLDEALAAFEAARRAEPTSVEVAAGCAQVLFALRRYREAIPYFLETDLFARLGDCYHVTHQYESAVEAYRRAVAVDAGSADTWYSLGCALNSMQAYAASAAAFERVIAMQPSFLEAHHNLGRALFETGRITEAMQHFASAAQGPQAELPLTMMALVAPGCAEYGHADLLALRSGWARRYLPRAERPKVPAFAGDRRISVGYLSSFFHRPNWMKPVWALIGAHDRSRFELFIFAESPAPAGMRDEFHDISALSNEEAARVIADCRLDLLVDLNCYSAPERLGLLALRPAPRIVAWFNLYATSGMACYDYLIGDSVVIPPAEEQFYCEKILRVAGSYLTFDVAYDVPEVAVERAARPFTFGCLASQYKITGAVLDAWCRILRAAPGSRMLIRNSALGAADVREYLLAEFVARGVAAHRVQLEGPAEHFEFLQTYDRIDVALDTFPYNGGTTTTEAIWQGVPVVTFLGDRWASRTSASLLLAGDLGEFVRLDVDDYVEFAVKLAEAGVVAGRSEMRSRLRRTAVCDVPGFTRQMEQLYGEIVRNIE